MLKVESFGVIPFKRDLENHLYVLLILHKKGNHWGFPKGKANPQETATQSATRELKEETGLEIVQFFSQTPIVEQYRFRHKGDQILKVVHYFPALVAGDLQLQAEEIRDAKWLTLAQADQLLSFKEARYILKSCIPFIEGDG